MALHAGLGLSRILVLAGAGYTGTIMMKNGKLSDALGDLQVLLGGKGDQNSESDLTAQIIRLTTEVQRMGAAQRITVVNGSGSSGNVTALIVPVAAAGALGYGYMRWKGLSFCDLMYVTKKSMGTAVTNLTKHLENVSEALAATKKHLTQRIQGLSDKFDKHEEMTKLIQQDVCTANGRLEVIGQNLIDLQSLVSDLDGRVCSMALKQDFTAAGVSFLIEFANGTENKLNVPEALQDHISTRPRLAPPKVEEDHISNRPRLALPKPKVKEGLKALGLGLGLGLGDITFDRSPSVVPGGIGNFEVKGRTIFRTCSTAKC